MGCMALNEVRAAHLVHQVRAIPLPKGANIISTKTEIGVLFGNGDHCDFRAFAIIEYYSDKAGEQAFEDSLKSNRNINLGHAWPYYLMVVDGLSNEPNLDPRCW